MVMPGFLSLDKERTSLTTFSRNLFTRARPIQMFWCWNCSGLEGLHTHQSVIRTKATG